MACRSKPLFGSLVVTLIGLIVFGCSEREELNRSQFETDETAAVVQHILDSLSEETKTEARIAYLSFGNYVADVATPEFLDRFSEESLRWVDGTGFQDKEFAGKRFIVDTTTKEELTPLMLQVRTIERVGEKYRIEAAWAFKEMLVRRLYEYDPGREQPTVIALEDILITGMPEIDEESGAKKMVEK